MDATLGEKQPTIDSLRKLCNGLGISLGDFFSEETDLALDIRQLISVAKTLTPEQRRALRIFLEVMKK